MDAVKVNLIFARQSIVGPHPPPGGIFAGSATTSKYGKFSITVPPVFLRMRLHVFIYITYPYIVGGRLSRHIAKVLFFRRFGGKLLLIFGMTGNRIVLKSDQCRNYVFNLDRQRGDCINHENYPLNFSFVIEGKLAGSAHPQRHSQLRSLFNDCGIRAILTLTEGDLSSHLRDRSDYILEQLEIFHIPIQDFTAPTMADLKRAVRWIYRMMREDKPVLVHCGAGLGRTGTILTAFFMSYYNLTTDDALARIRELRPGSVETSDQEDRLREFEGELPLAGLP
jgi:atypical dual specificity phosphatase